MPVEFSTLDGMKTNLPVCDEAPALEPDDAAAWQGSTVVELAARNAPRVDWLWPGYLARGNVTLLTSQWKTGKTTLLAVVLSRLHTGGRLADRDVTRGRAAVVTEENGTLWSMRGERLAIGPDSQFFCRPFAGKPTLGEWRAFVEHLDQLRVAGGLELVVIDTLASFIPAGAENHADGMLTVLRPLEKLTAAGVGVLLVHHPRKGVVQAGQASRGTGALSGYCDILIEMTCLPGARRDDRRRRLMAWSRHAETPRELVVELSADGCDYSATTDFIDPAWENGLETVREVLAEIGEPLTREMLLEAWPTEPKPAKNTLWRWLDRAVASGFVVRHGRGQRGAAFRYTLPGT
jgi:hypothetical protein